MNERRDNPRPQILACFRNLHSDPPVGDVNLFTCEAIGREKSSPVAAVSQFGEAKPPRQCIIIRQTQPSGRSNWKAHTATDGMPFRHSRSADRQAVFDRCDPWS